MGCGDSAEMKPAGKSIEQQFAEFGLQNLITGNFETDLERQIFMAINVCRAAPGAFVGVVRTVKQTHPLAKAAPHTMNLVNTLQQIKKLPPVKFD